MYLLWVKNLTSPNFFVMPMINDNCPELRTFMEKLLRYEMSNRDDSKESPIDYIVALIVVYMRRWISTSKTCYKRLLGLHWIVVEAWIPKLWGHTHPSHHMVRSGDHPIKVHMDAASLRQMRRPHAWPFFVICWQKSVDQLHQYCQSDCYIIGPRGRKLRCCKYGFSCGLNNCKCGDENGIRFL